MTAWHARAALLIALSFGTSLATGEAAAQSASQAEVDRAVALGREGRELYEAGRFADALEKFRSAERIAHSPVLVLHVARCERNLGRLVAARSAYAAVVLEELPPGAPAPFAAAKADAERELSSLDPRVPRVRLEVAGEGPTTRVILDGVVLAAAVRAEPVLVDPGDHVVAVVDGASRTERSFRAVEGAPVMTIELAADGATPPPGAAPPPRATLPVAPPPTEVEPRNSEGTLVPGLVALGIGVVGLGVGTATGLVAASETSDIESRCEGTSCLRSDQDQADGARTMATVSTIGFVVGGVGVATGVVLLIALSGDGDPAAARRGPSLAIAPSPLGVRGRLAF